METKAVGADAAVVLVVVDDLLMVKKKKYLDPNSELGKESIFGGLVATVD